TRGIQEMHGLPFTVLTPAFIAKEREGGEPRAAVKPAGQDDVVGQRFGFSGKIGKDTLSNVAREIRLGDLPQSSGINQVRVPADQLTERRLGAGSGVFPQKLRVCLRLHFTY